MNVSGIDVGYKTVVVAISKNGKQGKQRTFENTPSGHQELKKVPHSARVTRVGLEATGVYHPELAVALHESNRFELMVINSSWPSSSSVCPLSLGSVRMAAN